MIGFNFAYDLLEDRCTIHVIITKFFPLCFKLAESFKKSHNILHDADYVGFTARHLHQRIAEHKYSSIGKHLLEAHGDKNLLNEAQFCVLKKCHRKFDCLVYKMLFIQELRPSLNTLRDSISV